MRIPPVDFSERANEMTLKAIARSVVTRYTPPFIWKPMLKTYYLYRLTSYSRETNLENRARELYAIRNLIKRGDTVIDIGSNFGFYTLFLSRVVGESGSVYSIEPVPLTFEILSNNIKKLRLDNVRPLNYAISEKIGIAEMEIPEYGSGGESFYSARLVIDHNKTPSLRKYSIATKTLDSLFSGWEREISFIKIDVEGHEWPVNRGAEKVISRFFPALFIEVTGNPEDRKTKAFQLFNHLINRGYSPYWYDGNELKAWSKGWKLNYFFLTEKHLGNLA
jgi:FkbM family methyltransferase